MKRAISIGVLSGICLLLLCGCTAASNPLVQAEATAVPGTLLELHKASASDSNTSDFEATLYFRFLDTEMLAGESRVLTVQKDESNELAVLKALLEGPSAENLELRRLFDDSVTVQDVTAGGDTLFITFSNSFLKDGVPADWRTNGDWATEAPLLRKLTVESIVSTITDNFSYQNVQLMISRDNGSSADSRLEKAYFLTGQTGPSDPFVRDESCLLTAHRTALLVLQAWQERDYETLYTFTASYADRDTKPIYDAFVKELDAAPALSDYSVSPGSVSDNGQRAVQTVSLALHRNGQSEAIPSYPLQLVRENGLWKVSWPILRNMMID